MKRISLLVVLMVLWANVAMAATNWEWSCSSDKVGYFFDTTSVKYGKLFNGKTNHNIIYFWLKMVYTPYSSQQLAEIYSDEKFASCSSCLERRSINTSKRTMTTYESFYYDEQGNLLKSNKWNPPIESTVVPETYGEKVFIDVELYAMFAPDPFDSLPPAN